MFGASFLPQLPNRCSALMTQRGPAARGRTVPRCGPSQSPASTTPTQDTGLYSPSLFIQQIFIQHQPQAPTMYLPWGHRHERRECSLSTYTLCPSPICSPPTHPSSGKTSQVPAEHPLFIFSSGKILLILQRLSKTVTSPTTPHLHPFRCSHSALSKLRLQQSPL